MPTTQEKADVSSYSAEPSARGPLDLVRGAILPLALFILAEIMLVAETISVILFGGMDFQNPGATTIAVLLSVALLANLGLVCTMAAAFAADSVKRADARAVESAGDVDTAD